VVRPRKDVPIVCIAMSAGGVTPLQTIVRGLSSCTGMALVVVCHLNGTERTELPWLLSRWSGMRAGLARAGEVPEPNHIYVIPPGEELILEDGHFELRPRSKQQGWSNVITLFLNSLITARKAPHIAVILSGDHCDGTAALRAFHASGGITIVQDPDSTRHKGMPASALATGCIDYVLAPEAIAGTLEAISRLCPTHSRGPR
jgi:chemotaxis response regulator CheB